jgi:prepilin signal peptidase PulO-like enzyme (type II secretory pathway)
MAFRPYNIYHTVDLHTQWYPVRSCFPVPSGSVLSRLFNHIDVVVHHRFCLTDFILLRLRNIGRVIIWARQFLIQDLALLRFSFKLFFALSLVEGLKPVVSILVSSVLKSYEHVKKATLSMYWAKRTLRVKTSTSLYSSFSRKDDCKKHSLDVNCREWKI